MSLIIVHRFLQSFLLPPLNAMLLIIIGLTIWHNSKRFSLYLIIGGTVLLYIQSMPITTYYLSRYLELPPIQLDNIKSSQAIVVLSGGINNNGIEYNHDVEVGADTLIRLKYAAYLAHKFESAEVVVSGGSANLHKSEGDVMRRSLLNDFHVKNTILIEDKSRNTDENAKYVAKMLLPTGIKTIILVSQAYHVKRAAMLFHKYGFTVIPASTDYHDSIDVQSRTLEFLPSANAMHGTAIALHEIIGYWAYSF